MQKKTPLPSALSRKYPDMVALVTTADRRGRTNVMAVSWYTTVSIDPPMLLLGIDDEALTYRLIRKTKQFVVAFPSENMARQVLLVGTRHGHTIDKIKASGLKTQPASLVQAPLIADAVANFECELAEVYRPGDCPLLAGRIVAAHENTKKSIKRLYVVGSKYRMRGVRPA